MSLELINEGAKENKPRAICSEEVVARVPQRASLPGKTYPVQSRWGALVEKLHGGGGEGRDR